MIFYQNYRKEYVNPYRTGVKIGNYNEDLFGVELKQKYSKEKVDPKMFVSETMDKYAWPRPKTSIPRMKGNDMTMPQTSNFDLNIDFSQKNIEDYRKLQEKSPYILDDKNKFLREELNEDALNGDIGGDPKLRGKNLYNATQKTLSQSHVKDTNGLLYTKNSGLKSQLLMGHGMDQNNFYKTEYATTYQLAMSQKEKTDNFLDPHYKVKNQFLHYPPAMKHDDKDWNFRKYKIYDNFTKSYDVPYNLPHK